MQKFKPAALLFLALLTTNIGAINNVISTERYLQGFYINFESCGPSYAILKRGPRGGCYYINKNGNKSYVNRSCCN